MTRDAGDQGLLFEPTGAPLVMRTRRSTDRLLTELRRQQRLEPEHVGLVAMLRTMADLIDDEVGAAEPNKWTIARLAAEWRALHAELRGQADSWDAQLAAFFDDPAPVVSDGAPAVRDAP